MTTKPLSLPTQIDLDRFISVHAHDMRTPFNHVTGFSKMLINTVGDAPLDAMQKDDLNTVYRSGMRALSIVNGLIDIARLGRGEKDIALNDVEIQSLLDRAIAQWKKFHPGSETVIQSRNLATSTTLKADEQFFQQVVTGFIAYVEMFCESKATVNVTVEEEPKKFLFTFASSGLKARMVSELDAEMLGYVNRAFVELHEGKIEQAEETDAGATLVIAMPKK